MNQKERLLDLIIEAKKEKPDDVSFSDWLPDFLLANGVIVAPCKLGDPIYRVCAPKNIRQRPNVRKLNLTWNNLRKSLEDFGTLVFLTEEEAERVANGKK